MSQFDFGVIDPAVRDGSWLADALNQWRDALYSTHGGPAAPSYIVPGMIWRDVAGAPALTRYKVREGGVDRELWTIDNTGKVQFTGAGMATQAEVNAGAVVDKAVSPATLRGFTGWVAGPIGIGAAVPAGVMGYVYSAADHSILRLHAGSAAPVKWAQLSLQNASKNWFISNRDDGFLALSEATLGFAFNINPNGNVTIGAGNGGYKFEILGGNADTFGCITTSGANTAGFVFRNNTRFWGVGVGGDGTFRVSDWTAGRQPIIIDATGHTLFSPRSDGHGSVAIQCAADTAHSAVLYLNGYRNWDIRSELGEFRLRDNTANAQRMAIDANGKVWFTTWISGYALEGGVGGAGVVRSHTTANIICFRWTGSQFMARVDEAVEHQISAGLTNTNLTYLKNDPGGVGPFGWHLRAVGGGYDGYFVAAQQSDVRQKFKVEPAAVDALAVVRGVDMIEYNFIPANGVRVPLGFNAAQLRQHIPEMVFEPENAYLHVSLDRGVPWLFRAVQQLADRLDQLQKGE